MTKANANVKPRKLIRVEPTDRPPDPGRAAPQ
jgi:hypothetical protein